MKSTSPLHRHRPAITGIAALGLATTAMLAPAAHADTDVDRPEESASTAVVVDVEEAPGAAGGETAVEPAREAVAEAGEEAVTETGEEAAAKTGEDVAAGTGDQASTGTGEEVASEAGDPLLDDAEAVPAETTPAEAGQDDLCVEGATGNQQDGATEDAPAVETGTAATDTAPDGTAEEGTDVAAGLPDAASSGEGGVPDPGCAATAPDQADNGPGAQDGDETQLPVGGVDAGKGEAAGQNMVLPIATAGAVAAAVGLGAYTLVRRRRSDA